MKVLARLLALAAALAASGCTTLGPAQAAAAAQVAAAARSVQVDCSRDDACATPSRLRALGLEAMAASTPGSPRHHALVLDYGQDALLARLSMVRAARHSVDVQTYIFDEDDAGHLFLDELLAAARRGVRVRVLVDQLSALRKVETLAALAGAHVNFELRIYNPVLGRARINYPQYVLAAACCWSRLNRRMHNKLLLVDGVAGITGGRNYQDSYFDWDDEYNFRDRDLYVAGPVVAAMAASFERYWDARLVRRLPELADVGRLLLRRGVPALPHEPFARPARVARISRDADDPWLVESLAAQALPVGAVDFISDPPEKHRSGFEGVAPSTRGMLELVEGAREEVLLQTPYLVLSPMAQDTFRGLQERGDPPRVRVSTNSLAATDAFITYALSYKYLRRHLREFGFEIHEYKPFPQDAPIDVEATGTVEYPLAPVATQEAGVEPAQGRRRARPLEREYSALRWSGFAAHERVPLERGGVRFGLHSKSLVVDGRIGVVGTHNFDPRGDNYNTENAVVIEDEAFARTLADSIRRDMAPANSWVVAPRDRPTVLPGLDYSLGKVSESLPVFDLWPTRYATSYEFVPGPGCPAPLSPRDPDFRDCHEPVGDFPGVRLGFRSLLTRIFTAFGAGLAPIL